MSSAENSNFVHDHRYALSRDCKRRKNDSTESSLNLVQSRYSGEEINQSPVGVSFDVLNDLSGNSVPEGDLVNNHNQQKAVSKRTGLTSSPENSSMDENVIDPEKLKKILHLKAVMKSKNADDEYQLKLKQNERRFEEAVLKLRNDKQDEDDRILIEFSRKKRKIWENYYVKCVLNGIEPEQIE